MAEEEFVVKVKTLNGDTFEVNGSHTMQVSELKRRIAAAQGHPLERLRLIFRGKVLKDPQVLSDYSIQPNTVLHLVVRPAEAAASAPDSSSTPSPAAPPAQPAPTLFQFGNLAQFAASSSSNSNGSSNVIVGQIDLTASDAPLTSLNQIVGSMLQTAFTAAGSASVNSSSSNSASSPPAVSLFTSSFPSLNQAATHVNRARSILRQGGAPEAVADENHVELQQNVGDLVSLLRQSSSTLRDFQSSIDSLAASLEAEQKEASSPDARTSLRNSVRQQGQALLALSQAGSHLGRVLSGIDVPDEGPIQLNAPVPHSSPSQGSNPLSGILSVVEQIMGGSTPRPASTQPFAQSVQPNSSSSSTTPSGNSTSATGSSGSSASSSVQSFDLNSLRDSFNSNRPVQPSNRPIPPSSGHGATQGSSAAGVPFDLGGLMNTLMSQIPNLDAAVEVSDAESGASPGVEGLLADIMSQLSMPDLLGFVSGNWSALDRMRPRLKQRALTALNNDTSDRSVQALASSMSEGLADLLDESLISAEARSHLIPGKSIRASSVTALRSPMKGLLGVVLSDFQDPARADWFSLNVKTHCSKAVGAWVDALCKCFDNGSSTAYPLLQGVVSARLSSFAPEMAMFASLGAGLVGSIIQTCHFSYLQESSSSSSTISSALQGGNLSPQELNEVMEMIEFDEKRQYESRTQMTLSDAYISGASGGLKNGKPSSSPSVDLSNSIRRQLVEAIAESSPQDRIEGVVEQASQLSDLYRQLLVGELRRRVSEDPDFEPERFPNVESKILHPKPKH
eukprot:TRINITY_DN4015_c0_g1_i2.p1 TRINITY_DN4015_c0_g1~~TRINITY_DN4015_c0_g1_i2.p1  ORF type:complete len:791 (+),score=224.08 TRINITY_DN4015_c0_g1_i2:586-2958(+)